MADKIHVSLVTPTSELFSGDVDQVIAPGSEGEFGVLAGHAPLMTTLSEGAVTILDGDKKRTFQVIGGFADVNAEGITILAERAEEYVETAH